VTIGGEGVPPVTVVLQSLDGGAILGYLFPIVPFATFVEMEAVLVHELNERLDHTCRELGKSMRNRMRATNALTTLITVVAAVPSLTTLIEKGAQA